MRRPDAAGGRWGETQCVAHVRVRDREDRPLAGVRSDAPERVVPCSLPKVTDWPMASTGLTALREPPSQGRQSLRGASVSVVIPALNEADCIGWVLERIPGWVSEVVLVDGRSTDSTEVVARGLVTDLVVVHQPVLGKGAALRAGFAAASGEIIVMLDADGSTSPAELGRFVQALHGGAGFVKGSRHLPEGGSVDWTLLRRTGNWALVRLTNLVHGCDFTDLCYGYCAFWRRDLPALQLTADGFEVETALVLGAVKAGLKIREVPSVELSRLAGVSNLNAFRDGRRVLRTIFEQRPGRRARARARAATCRVGAGGAGVARHAGLGAGGQGPPQGRSAQARPRRLRVHGARAPARPAAPDTPPHRHRIPSRRTPRRTRARAPTGRGARPKPDPPARARLVRTHRSRLPAFEQPVTAPPLGCLRRSHALAPRSGAASESDECGYCWCPATASRR